MSTSSTCHLRSNEMVWQWSFSESTKCDTRSDAADPMQVHFERKTIPCYLVAMRGARGFDVFQAAPSVHKHVSIVCTLHKVYSYAMAVVCANISFHSDWDPLTTSSHRNRESAVGPVGHLSFFAGLIQSLCNFVALANMFVIKSRCIL